MLTDLRVSHSLISSAIHERQCCSPSAPSRSCIALRASQYGYMLVSPNLRAQRAPLGSVEHRRIVLHCTAATEALFLPVNEHDSLFSLLPHVSESPVIGIRQHLVPSFLSPLLFTAGQRQRACRLSSRKRT